MTTVPEFTNVGNPVTLFEAPLPIGRFAINVFQYDVSRDGRKFLIDSALPGATGAHLPITVVLNWPTLLKK